VTRLSTSGGRHWGITIGSYASRYKAEQMLLKTALAEIGMLDEALRKVVRGPAATTPRCPTDAGRTPLRSQNPEARGASGSGGVARGAQVEGRGHQRAGIVGLRASKISSASPASTMSPRFITITRWLSARTTFRSWLMNR
jgi:hypothetical protein